MTLQKELGINKDKTIADELYRIHCYSKTLATLCSTGGSDNAIDPEQLEQIFEDIAAVTDVGAAALNNASTNITALNDFAQRVFKKSTSKSEDLVPPFIKEVRIMGDLHRIYVPSFVNIKNRELLDILGDGIDLPIKYRDHQASDFELILKSDKGDRTEYLLIPLMEKQLPDESTGTYRERVGIRFIREP